ncbi:hypothetical protein KGA66_23145 [Actinocrinis puniceicyclus]|uniref:Uncharacterized protein n=1 Tax=Actinocrinis puniceicyclus TaxID=977794 RepID=A0A8J8BFA0_9ACTN|nr:hypothetical protein [Actinocrinis puniceicyclus]MBS2965961.1 hypothetical protein [Actinocrinis puniceicyclus]
MTLVPTSADRTELTPETLRELLWGILTAQDRVEHIKVIERTGLLWIGAYISIADHIQAQKCLLGLCDRLVEIIDGWELIRDPGL